MRISYLRPTISLAFAGASLTACSGAGAPSAELAAASSRGPITQSIARTAPVAYGVFAPGSIAPLPPPAHPPKPFVDVAAVLHPHGDQIIVSDFAASSVTVLDGNGKVGAVLTKGLSNPQGLFTDSAGTLYVANTGDSNMLVYPKPYTGVTRTYDDAGWYPSDVAVANDGTVAAANIISTNNGPGSVTMFAKGSTTPCATITDPLFPKVYFAAFDASGRLFVNSTNVLSMIVGVIVGECKATKITHLRTGVGLSFPGGIEDLRNGDLAIDDQGQRSVFTFPEPLPWSSTLGPASALTQLDYARDPVASAVTADGKNVWTADAVRADVAEYPYPAGGKPVRKLTPGFTQPAGIALNPGQ